MNDAPYLAIEGGLPLSGSVEPSGSKNGALPAMAAAILIDGPIRLDRVPLVDDVATLEAILNRLGVESKWTGPNRLTLTTDPKGPCRADYDLVGKMRAGFCVLGPLLARRGSATVALPGGCSIGHRPVDLHLAGLTALGAKIKIEHGLVIATAERLQGAEIDLAGRFGSTVTGTANIMSAATLAKGKTVIHHAAIEPELIDLGRLLIKLGAKIDGLGTDTVEIEGVDRLGAVDIEHRLIPDRIEAATLLLATAVTGGSIELTGVAVATMTATVDCLATLGCQIQSEPNRIQLKAPSDRLQPASITTKPYPALPTDLQPIVAVAMSLADGKSQIHETIFPDRFGYLDELARLGAVVDWTPGLATINGVKSLSGAELTGTDLRATAALVLGALAAKGKSRVHGLEHLDRGYEQLENKLRQLGAKIERVGR
jgi:UDP-N-acetylglucosamine 1-carboxyvinyltransferase